jgi:hypothetical protein
VSTLETKVPVVATPVVVEPNEVIAPSEVLPVEPSTLVETTLSNPISEPSTLIDSEEVKPQDAATLAPETISTNQVKVKDAESSIVDTSTLVDDDRSIEVALVEPVLVLNTVVEDKPVESTSLTLLKADVAQADDLEKNAQRPVILDTTQSDVDETSVKEVIPSTIEAVTPEVIASKPKSKPSTAKKSSSTTPKQDTTMAPKSPRQRSTKKPKGTN